MKTTSLIILTTFFASVCCGQTKNAFVINETFVKKNIGKKSADNFKRHSEYFFEDEFYTCFKTCHGEFGGTVIFKNKKSGTESIFEATCPITVNRLNGKYIVTTTLAHMQGSSRIFEIPNPDSLNIHNLNEGTKDLIDTFGILTLTSFVYKDQLYHIVTDFKKTFVAKIENSNFVNIAQISNESISTYGSDQILTDDNHCIVFFSNKEAKGYIDIFENEINLTRYK